LEWKRFYLSLVVDSIATTTCKFIVDIVGSALPSLLELQNAFAFRLQRTNQSSQPTDRENVAKRVRSLPKFQDMKVSQQASKQASKEEEVKGLV